MKGLTTLVLLVTLVFAGIASFYFLEHQKTSQQLAASLDNIAQLQGEVRKLEAQLDHVRQEETGSEDAVKAANVEAEKWRTEAQRLIENRGRLESQVKELGALVVAKVAKAELRPEAKGAVPSPPKLEPPPAANPIGVLSDALKAQEKDDRLQIGKGDSGPVITVQSKKLFGPGPAELKGEGKQLLLDVGKAIKAAGSPGLRIEAHTDNVPMGPKYRDRYPTNKELSEERARVVAGFMADAAGIVSNRVGMAGLADAKPVAGNDTPEGRAKNSRVEIHVIR